MSITLLIQIIIALVLLLAILLFLFIYVPSQQKKKETKIVKKEKKVELAPPTLNALLNIVRNKNTTSTELKEALDLVLEHHGTIDKKIGIRPSPNFDVYGHLLIMVCRHPNTNKDIVLGFDRGLESRNPTYKQEINEFVTKGLNSRGK
ncbi:hypothetical protein GJV85_00830 [Sulfurimonas aquatica]|uniref:Uncharacterized protein n=1 Tax=Sulfurimonas aquatica TaxID=2672570 RepID=A0A975AY49_9BACT|nr:hypothetical protein [Sulfurimonas aquatica]QSZ40721.1 hypothetical protein GJV85_00830 [Sulfurimonas aquatica]